MYYYITDECQPLSCLVRSCTQLASNTRSPSHRFHIAISSINQWDTHLAELPHHPHQYRCLWLGPGTKSPLRQVGYLTMGAAIITLWL